VQRGWKSYRIELGEHHLTVISDLESAGVAQGGAHHATHHPDGHTRTHFVLLQLFEPIWGAISREERATKEQNTWELWETERGNRGETEK
jgi:hypothetical protein